MAKSKSKKGRGTPYITVEEVGRRGSGQQHVVEHASKKAAHAYGMKQRRAGATIFAHSQKTAAEFGLDPRKTPASAGPHNLRKPPVAAVKPQKEALAKKVRTLKEALRDTKAAKVEEGLHRLASRGGGDSSSRPNLRVLQGGKATPKAAPATAAPAHRAQPATKTPPRPAHAPRSAPEARPSGGSSTPAPLRGAQGAHTVATAARALTSSAATHARIERTKERMRQSDPKEAVRERMKRASMAARAIDPPDQKTAAKHRIAATRARLAGKHAEADKHHAKSRGVAPAPVRKPSLASSVLDAVTGPIMKGKKGGSFRMSKSGQKVYVKK